VTYVKLAEFTNEDDEPVTAKVDHGFSKVLLPGDTLTVGVHLTTVTAHDACWNCGSTSGYGCCQATVMY
jgi:hypothetical protein